MKNKIKDENSPLTNVPVFVSLADLIIHFKDRLEVAEKNETCQDELEKILHEECGFDKTYNIFGKVQSEFTGEFYEVMNCEHRARCGVIVKCDRYMGMERLDKDWLNSGRASYEAKLAAKGDKSLIEVLENMKNGGDN